MMNTTTHECSFDSRPIGVFDSGVGGLTVAREIARRLPSEAIVYFGDTLRFPYGPRPLDEIRLFARQISRWLARQDVKLIVIACNSATAAALDVIQQESTIPVIGVVEPGARAAMWATTARRVGVIGTVATIESDAYSRAIRSLDAGITTFSVATPRFVEMVEQGLRLDNNPIEDIVASASSLYIRPAFLEIARDYLNPLKRCMIDTLVLGCTHYPLLTPLIAQVMGPGVTIISSAEETAREVAEILERRGQFAAGAQECAGQLAAGAQERAGQLAADDLERAGQLAARAQERAGQLAADDFGRTDQLAQETRATLHRFVTSAPDSTDFITLWSAIFGEPIAQLQLVTTDELQELSKETS